MRVLTIEPGKLPYEQEIDGSLESMQTIVGGNIEAVYPFEDPVALICNEEGKLNNLPCNRALFDEHGRVVDIVAGTFFIAGVADDDFTSLATDMMEKYFEQYKHPEKFLWLGREILSIKQPIEAILQEVKPSVDAAHEPDWEPEM